MNFFKLLCVAFWLLSPCGSRAQSVGPAERLIQRVMGTGSVPVSLSLADVPDDIAKSDLFVYDLAQWTAAYVGGKLEILTTQIEKAYAAGKAEKAQELESVFESLMVRTDALLAASAAGGSKRSTESALHELD